MKPMTLHTRPNVNRMYRQTCITEGRVVVLTYYNLLPPITICLAAYTFPLGSRIKEPAAPECRGWVTESIEYLCESLYGYSRCMWISTVNDETAFEEKCTNGVLSFFVIIGPTIVHDKVHQTSLSAFLTFSLSSGG
jgi:hypothetical protein